MVLPLLATPNRLARTAPSGITVAILASVLLAATSGCAASAPKSAEEPSAVPAPQVAGPPAPEPRDEEGGTGAQGGLGLREGVTGAQPTDAPGASVSSSETKDAEAGGEGLGDEPNQGAPRRSRAPTVLPSVDQTIALIEEYERIMVGGSDPGRPGGVDSSKPKGCDEACAKLAEMAREVDRLCDLVGESDERCVAKRRSLADIRQSSALASCRCTG